MNMELLAGTETGVEPQLACVTIHRTVVQPKGRRHHLGLGWSVQCVCLRFSNRQAVFTIYLQEDLLSVPSTPSIGSPWDPLGPRNFQGDVVSLECTDNFKRIAFQIFPSVRLLFYH
jgi:hypothetical protein